MYTLSYVLGREFQNLKKYLIFVLSELLNKGIFVGPLWEKNSLDVAKEKQKALVTQLQPPESFPPGCSTNQGTFSAKKICVWKVHHIFC